MDGTTWRISSSNKNALVLKNIWRSKKKMFRKTQIWRKRKKRPKVINIIWNTRLTTKTSPWFGKSMEYSIALYSYYECYKCKNPYFGGLKSCENGIDEGPNKEFKPEELVCANCCDVMPIENC